MGRTIAVDFDGVINGYTGWKGKGVFEAPVPGAKEALGKLSQEGWTIIINTTRLEVDKVKEYLDHFKIPYHHINFNPRNIEQQLHPCKVLADVYLDDRAVRFDGDWGKALEAVKNSQVWWRK